MGCVRMMKLKSFTAMNGSLLQILNIVGESLILMIICDANLGVTWSCFA